MKRAMMIGDLARLTGTKANTIRFYEGIGLLRQAPRTASGRRVYDASDVRRLTFIRQGRSLGFSIEEIRSLLVLVEDPERDCAEAAAIARQHLQGIETRISQLEALRGALSDVATTCGGGRAGECRVIEAISKTTAPQETAQALS